MTDVFEFQNKYRRGPEFFGKCALCGQQAAHKLEEELFYDDIVSPFERVHPMTTEVCGKCFRRLFMNYSGVDGQESPSPESVRIGRLERRLARARKRARELELLLSERVTKGREAIAWHCWRAAVDANNRLKSENWELRQAAQQPKPEQPRSWLARWIK